MKIFLSLIFLISNLRVLDARLGDGRSVLQNQDTQDRESWKETWRQQYADRFNTSDFEEFEGFQGKREHGFNRPKWNQSEIEQFGIENAYDRYNHNRENRPKRTFNATEMEEMYESFGADSPFERRQHNFNPKNFTLPTSFGAESKESRFSTRKNWRSIDNAKKTPPESTASESTATESTPPEASIPESTPPENDELFEVDPTKEVSAQEDPSLVVDEAELITSAQILDFHVEARKREPNEEDNLE